MATVGQQLLEPEGGWQRYDDKDSRIKYYGNDWVLLDATYGSYTTTITGASISFKFYGTKLRTLVYSHTNRVSHNISIDGVSYGTYATNMLTTTPLTLVKEITGLSLQFHNVVITTGDIIGTNFGLDAIDIDSTGYLIGEIKFLVKKDNDIYSVKSDFYGVVGSDTPTEDIFLNNGIDNLSTLSTEISFKSLPPTLETVDSGKLFSFAIDKANWNGLNNIV